MDYSKYENGDIFNPLQKELIAILERNGPMTRKDICASVNKSRTTVYDNLTRLGNYNLVKKFSRPTNSKGRPLVFFKFMG